MNVLFQRQTNATSTLCVRTLKDPMSVAASRVLREMGKLAQVKTIVFSIIILVFSPRHICLELASFSL